MARVTAIRLRDEARAAMLSAGGHGFMRFLPAGGALLATDAIRRCGDDVARAQLTDDAQKAMDKAQQRVTQAIGEAAALRTE